MDRSFVQSILDIYKQVSQVEETNGKLLTEYTIDDADNIKSLDSAKVVAKCHIQRSEYYQQQATERDQELITVTKQRVYKLRIAKEGISQYIPVKIIVNPKSSEPVVVIFDEEDDNYEQASRLKIGLSLEEQKVEAIVASEGIQEIDHDATNVGLDMATNDNTMTFSNTNTSPITQQIYQHCIKCQAVLNSDNWYDGSRKASVYICKPCDKARHAAYRKVKDMGFDGTKRRKGTDIIRNMTISAEQALKGGELPYPITVGNNKRIRLTIPAKISDGGTLVVRGYGEPSEEGGANGDLLFMVSVLQKKMTIV